MAEVAVVIISSTRTVFVVALLVLLREIRNRSFNLVVEMVGDDVRFQASFELMDFSGRGVVTGVLFGFESIIIGVVL